MDCCINTLSGELCTIKVHVGWTVGDVKRAVQDCTGILFREQRLVWQAAELLDHQFLERSMFNSVGPALELTLLRRAPDSAEWMERISCSGPDILKDAPVHVTADACVIAAAVARCGKALKFASVDLRSDRQLVEMAVKQNGRALQYASKDLCADRRIAFEAIKQNAEALRFVAPEIRPDYRRFALARSSQQSGDATTRSRWLSISQSRSL